MNPNMTLEDFKVIFYWEYAHRFLARLLGLFFILPFFIFISLKRLTMII